MITEMRKEGRRGVRMRKMMKMIKLWETKTKRVMMKGNRNKMKIKKKIKRKIKEEVTNLEKVKWK